MGSWRRVLDRRLGAIRAKLGVAAQQPNEGNDRQVLERLLRYCARPCWASERLLEAGDGEHLVYLLPKPGVDGASQIRLTPLVLIDRLAKFTPPPRRHPHRYHGVFAPHARLRGKVVDRAGQAVLRWDEPAPSEPLAQRVRQALGLSVAMELLQPESAAPASPGASQWVRL